MTRLTRRSFAAIAASTVALAGVRSVKAQFSEQDIRNGAQITSTGDVTLEQSASGTQQTEVWTDDGWQSADGVYHDGQTQIVVNEGQVVSTGNVNVRQSASGTQTTTVVTWPSENGQRAERCQPGAVMANPNSGQLFYQGHDCCWWAACANACLPTPGCHGDTCGTGK